jgi:tryptophan 2,3-dioxygenase
MDENWWEFSIRGEVRADKDACRLGAPFEDVNPTTDGRQQLSYHSYLRLDRLLNAQIPSSRIADERPFIITHQLYELAFKLCVFDLVVIAATLQALLDLEEDEDFRTVCLDEGDQHGFWRPALTAAQRVRHTCTTVTQNFIGYLDARPTAGRFDVNEFLAFRLLLTPASGFQSAQFRVIQHALGKLPILQVPLFPVAEYAANYRGESREDLVRVQDELVLGAPATSPSCAPAEALDDLAHQVLTRLGRLGCVAMPISGVPMVSAAFVTEAVNRMEDLLKEHLDRLPEESQASVRAVHESRIAQFRRDLQVARDNENERRKTLGLAREAATFLQRHTTTPLYTLLQALVAADQGLHHEREKSFLSEHYAVASYTLNHLPKGDPTGTGGGGLKYLLLTYKYLFPPFSALIAFR